MHLKLMQMLLVIQGKRKSAASPMVTINAVRNTYTLASDVATLLERAANETIPAFRDDKPADSLAARHAQVEHTICTSTALRSDVSLPGCCLDQKELQAEQTAADQVLLCNDHCRPNNRLPQIDICCLTQHGPNCWRKWATHNCRQLIKG